jgi:adenosine deaminase
VNLVQEYAEVATAVGYGWDDMVQIALDGAEAYWLDETAKAVLRRRIADGAAEHGPAS